MSKQHESRTELQRFRQVVARVGSGHRLEDEILAQLRQRRDAQVARHDQDRKHISSVNVDLKKKTSQTTFYMRTIKSIQLTRLKNLLCTHSARVDVRQHLLEVSWVVLGVLECERSLASFTTPKLQSIFLVTCTSVS